MVKNTTTSTKTGNGVVLIGVVVLMVAEVREMVVGHNPSGR